MTMMNSTIPVTIAFRSVMSLCAVVPSILIFAGESAHAQRVVDARGRALDSVSSSNGVGAPAVVEAAGWQVASDILRASPSVIGDGYGSAAAMNEAGTVLVIGASDTTVADAAAVGAVHIYRFDDATGWTHVQKLDCPPTIIAGTATPASLSLFGWSVAVSGNTIVVGAPVVSSGVVALAGKAYVFQLNATDNLWGNISADARVANRILSPSDPEMIGFFGGSVAVDVVAEGDTRIAVGSPFRGAANQGGVYIYEGSGNLFPQKQFLIPSEVVGQDNFGTKLALDGNVLVVGSQVADIEDRLNCGSAHVYRRAAKSGTWSTTPEAVLFALNGERDDGFGSAVAVQGDTIAIGAPGVDRDIKGITTLNNGSVYMYRFAGGQWTSDGEELFAREANGGNVFGFSLALANAGTKVIVGSPGYETTLVNTGAGFDFVRLAGVWTLQPSDLWSTAAITSQSIGEQTSVSANGLRAVLGSRNPAGLIATRMYAWEYSNEVLPEVLPVGTPPTAQAPGADGFAPTTTTTTTPPGGVTPSTGLGSGGLGNMPAIPATPITRPWGLVRASVLAIDRAAARVGIIMTDGLHDSGLTAYEFLGSYDPSWEVLGVGDVNGDGSGDVLFRDPATRKVKAWIRLGNRITETVTVGTTAVGDRFIGIGDWSGTGFDAPAFLRADGVNAVFWVVNSGAITDRIDWQMPVGEWTFFTSDVTGDGNPDLIARDIEAGTLVRIDPEPATEAGALVVAMADHGKDHRLVAAQEFDGDGTNDLLWEGPDGEKEFWFMRPDGTVRYKLPWPCSLEGWTINMAADFDNNGAADLMFSKSGSEVLVMRLEWEALSGGRGNMRGRFSRVLDKMPGGFTVLGVGEEPLSNLGR